MCRCQKVREHSHHLGNKVDSIIQQEHPRAAVLGENVSEEEGGSDLSRGERI